MVIIDLYIYSFNRSFIKKINSNKKDEKTNMANEIVFSNLSYKTCKFNYKWKRTFKIKIYVTTEKQTKRKLHLQNFKNFSVIVRAFYI